MSKMAEYQLSQQDEKPLEINVGNKKYLFSKYLLDNEELARAVERNNSALIVKLTTKVSTRNATLTITGYEYDSSLVEGVEHFDLKHHHVEPCLFIETEYTFRNKTSKFNVAGLFLKDLIAKLIEKERYF